MPSLNPVYKRVFDCLADADRYCTWTVKEFYVDRAGRPAPDRVNVVVRIDVDSGLHLEPMLAEALADRGIHASHYFLPHPDSYYQLWGSGVPRQVAHMPGQEIGLHSDHHYQQLAGGPEALQQIRADVRKLAEEADAPIHGMVYHGHPAINAMNRSNSDAYRNVAPDALGLTYHDGADSCYTTPTHTGRWQPPCDRRYSDFCGIANSDGWVYQPRRPLKVLAGMKRGEVLHLSLHTRNAFRYWEDWPTDYGEEPVKRQSTVTFYKNKCRIVVGRNAAACWRGVRAAIDVSLRTICAVGRVVAPSWARADPYLDWDHHNRSIWDEGLEPWRQRLRDMGIDWADRDVLEIGSGPGQWLAAMTDRAHSAQGVEPNPRMLQIARAEYAARGIRGVELHSGVAEELPCAAGSVDVVLCLGVLQFTRPKLALDQIARVLRPGGRAYIAANGFGYFVMRAQIGLGNGEPRRLRQGLAGLVNGVRQLLGHETLASAKPFTPRVMRRFARKTGLELMEARPWLPRPLYKTHYMGLPTNLLFVLRRANGEQGDG